jgi:hypothetical protein
MKMSANPQRLCDVIEEDGPITVLINDEPMEIEEMLDLVGDLIFDVVSTEGCSLSEMEEVFAEMVPEHETTMTQVGEDLRLRIDGHKFEIDITFNPDEIMDGDPSDTEFSVIKAHE